MGKNPLDPTVGTTWLLISGDGRFFKATIALIGQELGEAFSAIFVGNVARHELGHTLGLEHADFDWTRVDLSCTGGDLMSSPAPTNVGTVEMAVSTCDKDAFAGAHAWYPSSSPLGDPADFDAPTAGTLVDC